MSCSGLQQQPWTHVAGFVMTKSFRCSRAKFCASIQIVAWQLQPTVVHPVGAADSAGHAFTMLRLLYMRICTRTKIVNGGDGGN